MCVFIIFMLYIQDKFYNLIPDPSVYKLAKELCFTPVFFNKVTATTLINIYRRNS